MNFQKTSVTELAFEFDEEMSSCMCGCEGSHSEDVASSLRGVEVLNRHVFKEIYQHRNQSPRPYINPLLRRPKKSKTQVAVAVGGNVPVAVGDTREPRTEVPATTPVDAFGA